MANIPEEDVVDAQRIWAKVQAKLAESSPPTPIEIVDATADDVYGIRQVQREAWLATYPNEEYGITQDDIEAVYAGDETDKENRSLERMKKSYEDPMIHTWVAKDGSTIIGVCTGKKEGNNNRIWMLYVLSEYQGRGVGKQLMVKGLEWLGDDKDVCLDVASYNDWAITFYQKFGFIVSEKEVAPFILPSGKSIPEIEMVKKAKQL